MLIASAIPIGQCAGDDPNGQSAVSASTGRTLKVWELASGCELRALTGRTGCVACSSAKIVSVHDGSLEKWEREHSCED
jgi:hypothetical protein